MIRHTKPLYRHSYDNLMRAEMLEIHASIRHKRMDHQVVRRWRLDIVLWMLHAALAFPRC